MNHDSKLELGCGLIRIGRIWGEKKQPIPSNKEVQSFLRAAYEMKIKFFDTAPAYGKSEKRLGQFLKQLSKENRQNITVATKFGEHWVDDFSNTIVDHSYEALKTSLNKSIKLLGKVDVLQIHKASIEVINSDSISKALNYAKTVGVSKFGASISDAKAGHMAVKDKRFEYIQLPFNLDRQDLLPVIKKAKKYNKKILFNRPLLMGGIFNSKSNKSKEEKIIKAYSTILKTNTAGVVLSGTASISHLTENLQAFNKAKKI